MDKNQLFDAGMKAFDEGRITAAAVNLKKAAEAGHPKAFGILYALYTTPDEFPATHKTKQELERVLQYFAIDKQDAIAMVYVALDGGNEARLDTAVERAEKASKDMCGEDFQLLGPTYIQIVSAYSGIYVQSPSDKERIVAKIRRCFNQCKRYAEANGIQDMLGAIGMMAAHFGITL